MPLNKSYQNTVKAWSTLAVRVHSQKCPLDIGLGCGCIEARHPWLDTSKLHGMNPTKGMQAANLITSRDIQCKGVVCAHVKGESEVMFMQMSVLGCEVAKLALWSKEL